MRFTGGWEAAAGTILAASFEAEEAALGLEFFAGLRVAGVFADIEETFERADALAGFAALADFEGLTALTGFDVLDLADLVTGSGFFSATFLEGAFFEAGADFFATATFFEAEAAFLEAAAFFAGVTGFDVLPLPETAAFGLADFADLAGTEVLRVAMKMKRSVSGLCVQEGAIQQLTGNTTPQPIAR